MKTSILFLALFFLLMVISCDVCTWIDPTPPPKHEVGDTLWIHESSELPYYIKGKMALGKDGSVYYAEGGQHWSEFARIVALNKDDGSVKWRSGEIDYTSTSGEIVVDDDGIIYAIGKCKLFAISPDDGRFLWIWEVPETLPHPDNPDLNVGTMGGIGSLALTNQGNLVVASVEAGAYWRGVYCIDKNGNRLWYNLSDANLWGLPNMVIGKDGHLYYYILDPRRLVSLDAVTGIRRWYIESDGTSGANNILINEDGYLFCSFAKSDGEPRRLHKINPDNGDIIWSSAAETTFGTRWMGPDGVIYEFFQFEGGWNKFNMQTGAREPIVCPDIPNPTHLISLISDKNQLYLCHATNGAILKLGMISPDGNLHTNLVLDGVNPVPMLLSDDEIIYLVADVVEYVPHARKIVAIQGNAKLAKTGWPRISHDNRNTFNVNKH